MTPRRVPASRSLYTAASGWSPAKQVSKAIRSRPSGSWPVLLQVEDRRGRTESAVNDGFHRVGVNTRQ